WAFLEPYLAGAEAVIVSRPVYAPPSTPPERVVVVPPSIDPFSAKNAPLPNADVERTLVRAGLRQGMDDGLGIRFRRRYGGTDVLRRHTSSRSEEHTSELQSRENLVCR